MFDDISDIVMLSRCHFPAPANNNFVATFAEIFFIMHQEILASLHPNGHFRKPSISASSNLFPSYQKSDKIQDTYSNCFIHLSMSDHGAKEFLTRRGKSDITSSLRVG